MGSRISFCLNENLKEKVFPASKPNGLKLICPGFGYGCANQITPEGERGGYYCSQILIFSVSRIPWRELSRHFKGWNCSIFRFRPIYMCCFPWLESSWKSSWRNLWFSSWPLPQPELTTRTVGNCCPSPAGHQYHNITIATTSSSIITRARSNSHMKKKTRMLMGEGWQSIIMFMCPAQIWSFYQTHPLAASVGIAFSLPLKCPSDASCSFLDPSLFSDKFNDAFLLPCRITFHHKSLWEEEAKILSGTLTKILNPLSHSLTHSMRPLAFHHHGQSPFRDIAPFSWSVFWSANAGLGYCRSFKLFPWGKFLTLLPNVGGWKSAVVGQFEKWVRPRRNRIPHSCSVTSVETIILRLKISYWTENRPSRLIPKCATMTVRRKLDCLELCVMPGKTDKCIT